MLVSLQQQVLFWVFMGFFVIIGFASLLVQLKVIDADDAFRKWSLPSFIAAVVAVIIGLAKVTFSPTVGAPLFATVAPQGLDGIDLIQFQIEEALLLETQTVGPITPGTTQPLSEPTTHQLKRRAPSTGPSWEVEIPPNVLGSLVKLRVRDQSNVWWESNAFNTNYVGSLRVEKKQIKEAQHGGLLPSAMAADQMLISKKVASPSGRHLKFNNYARPIQKYGGRQYYQWRVFIDEPDNVLDTIQRVRYLLHPTFPEMIQFKCDPSSKFALQSSGWGGFTISMEITYRDKREDEVQYYLDLNKSWPDKETDLKPEKPCQSNQPTS